MDFINEGFPLSHWLSLGHDQPYATSMHCLQTTLLKGIYDLRQLNQAPSRGADSETHIMIAATELPQGLLFPDDSLVPLWEQFADALGHLEADKDGCIVISIGDVKLSTEELSILEPVLKTAPLSRLIMVNNMLGRAGIEFVTNVIEANASTRVLLLKKNEIGSGAEALSLVKAASNQPQLQHFHVEECNFGSMLSTAPEIIPALLNLEIVSLQANGLGSHAASLISNSLATNPRIESLLLDDNVFNDDDAALIAQSLKCNTNLVCLHLRGNDFTEVGIKTFYRSIFDDQSLDTIHDSNHTCELTLLAEGQPTSNGINEAVLSINGEVFDLSCLSPLEMLQYLMAANEDVELAGKMFHIQVRKKTKMIYALRGGNSGHFNDQYLNEVPLKLMPRVLAFFLESAKYPMEENSLDVLFQMVRSRPGILPSCETAPPRDILRMKNLIALAAVAGAMMVRVGRRRKADK